MFDIVGKRFRFFLISGVIILAGIIALATLGLTLGIEFSSGVEVRMSFEEEVSQSELTRALADLGYDNAVVQTIISEEGVFLIRAPQLSEEEQQQLETDLTDKFGALEGEAEFRLVSSEVATGTASTAAIAVGVAAIGILLYMTWAFRRMPRPLNYGTCAVIALVHDVVVVMGIFSILSGMLNWEINLMFITGILAVIGYTVNNTVVVFDRIRENLARGISADFEVVVNSSLIETLGRSLNTSLTTLVVVLALLLFVGVSIQNFAVVLLIGILTGTYSSVCIAPQLLVVWQKREWRRFIPWLSRPAAKSRGR